MKGTIVYDVVTTIGIIILIFMVIYWSLVFGTDTVAGMLLTSPSVVQASLSSAFSFGCRTEDYDFTYIIEKPTQFDLNVVGNAVQAVPPAKKLRDWTTIERGGYTQYRSINPSPTITCSRTPLPTTKSFTSASKSKIKITKNSTFFGLEVR
ncbi:MAG TPA: hypothetical protein VI933_03815 [archaeon]|nr:hypothetical protein [archaeon]